MMTLEVSASSSHNHSNKMNWTKTMKEDSESRASTHFAPRSVTWSVKGSSTTMDG